MKNGFKYAIIPTIVTCNAILAQDHRVLIPDIQGEWWQIAGNPGLGEYTDEKQQPVDFGIWQAADGSWQLWSCIRHPKCGGNTRLFYRWEGTALTESAWTPMGIAMEADTSFGETSGGLQGIRMAKLGWRGKK